MTEFYRDIMYGIKTREYVSRLGQWIFLLYLTICSQAYGDGTDKIIGRWQFDFGSVEEQLRAGSQLQVDWCGYGWHEGEIQRRLSFVKDIELKVDMTISKIGQNEYKWLSRDGDEPTQERWLKNCHVLDNGMISCEVTPDWKGTKPFVVDVEGKSLYMMVKIRPSDMQCKPIVGEAESRWYRGLSMIKFGPGK